MSDPSAATELFERHRERLERAVEASRVRGYWSPFIESPSRKLHPEGARDAGRARFDELLGRPFPLTMPGEVGRVGDEVSPYTGAALGIDYPAVDPAPLFSAMRAAMPAWRDAGPLARVGVCMEILDRLARDVFANTWATMHTAGQAYMMAFAGSGANSLDRGLEGLAYAHQAMAAVPERATFARRFGRGEPVVLDKRYRLIPRGVAVVITCGSYPAWNAYPAIMANLATGNPVVVKPQPGAVLPMAMAVQHGRDVLTSAGFDPNLLTLAADTFAAPITKDLLAHPDTAIVDFTGSQAFGAWIEDNCRHALVYTETAGCNAVVLESAHDLDAVLHAIAHSLTLFSAQMCTSAQNIWIPRGGVRTPAGLVDVDDVARRLVACIDSLVAEPAMAAGVCGALQSTNTLRNIEAATRRAERDGSILRRSGDYAHPDHPEARTATPLVVRVDAEDGSHREEHFGPIGFLIVAADRDDALRRASDEAREHGAIASYAYSTDETFLEAVQDAFANAGASVGCNLVRQLPINFTAAFSDYHVTGLNPAGSACLTDLAFVTDRFRIVQSKVERPVAPGVVEPD